MDYEQDYLVRMIKQMVAAIMNLLFKKAGKVYELPLKEQYEASQGELRELLTMVNQGKINEAENRLLDQFYANDTKRIEEALLFYTYLNELDNDYLSKCNFSREEIEQGISRIAKQIGLEDMIEIFRE